MNNKPKILVVEDDKAIRNLITTTLETQGYQYHTAGTGSASILEAVSNRPDLMILDLGLPDMDGVEIIKKVRGWSNLPIIVVSARSLSLIHISPLVVAKNHQVLGVIHLKDIIKQGVKEKFADLRKMGIKTIMITGDNPLTAAAIAAEAGVDDFLAEATPEGKLKLIREYQAQGHLVAMTGDGTNDAPALAQADVAVAMNLSLIHIYTRTISIKSKMVKVLMTPTSVLQKSITCSTNWFIARLPPYSFACSLSHESAVFRCV